MTKKTLVRVADSLTLTPEQIKNIRNLFPDQDVEIEHYGKDRPIHRFYEERQQSLFKAFNLVVETLFPEIEQDSIALGQKITVPNFIPDDSAKHHQNKLVDYVNTLVSTLVDFAHEERPESPGTVSANLRNSCRKKHHRIWSYLLLKTPNRQYVENLAAECKHLLEKAEHYVILREGHPDLVTLFQPPRGVYNDSDVIMLWDKQIKPFTAETLQELERIKQSTHTDTFLWFSKLDNATKLYLHSTDEVHTKLEHYQSDLHILLSNWKEQEQDINTLNADIECIIKGEALPEWFKKLKQSGQILQIFLREKYPVKPSLILIQASLENLDNQALNDLVQLKKLPLWFLLLEDFEQLFLRKALQTSSAEDISFISSRHRTIPAMSNFGSHRVSILDKSCQILKDFPERIRSSHMVSRDVRHYPKSAYEVYIERNHRLLDRYTDQHFSGQDLLLQTLVSPMYIVPEDYFLETQRQEFLSSLETNKKNHATNHPLNAAQYFLSIDPGCYKLLKKAKKFLIDNPCEELSLLINKYEASLKPGISSNFDGSAPNFESSAYEELIALSMGIVSYGSCVSGKDRKALVLLCADTHLIYREWQGSWLDPKDAHARAQWSELFVSLYCSWHMQTHAGFNAPGSQGIKHPMKYLPVELRKLLTDDLLNIEDAMASNNVVKNIHKTNKNLQSGLPLILEKIIHQITPDQQRIIVAEVKDIVFANYFWKNKTQYIHKMIGNTPCPEGIKRLQQAFNNLDNPKDILKKCLLIIDERMRINSNRSNSTSAFYQLLMPLTNAHNKPVIIKDLIAQLRQFKSENKIIPVESECDAESDRPVWRTCSL